MKNKATNTHGGADEKKFLKFSPSRLAETVTSQIIISIFFTYFHEYYARFIWEKQLNTLRFRIQGGVATSRGCAKSLIINKREGRNKRGMCKISNYYLCLLRFFRTRENAHTPDSDVKRMKHIFRTMLIKFECTCVRNSIRIQKYRTSFE